MSNPLPILRNTTGTLNAQVLYPFTRSVTFSTMVNTFMNGSEQRWPNTPPLYGFACPMQKLLTADKASWLSFFNSQQGRFNQSLALTLHPSGGLSAVTYGNLSLQTDSLTVVNPESQQYNQQIVLRQVNNYPYTAPTPGTSFPGFLSGSAVAQQPFTQISSFLTDINDNMYGPRFAFEYYGASLSNFPSGYLQSWDIKYGLLTQAQAIALENFFLTQQGRLSSFSFTDPVSSSTVTHVRFDQDTLEISYITVNQFSIFIKLKQTNGS